MPSVTIPRTITAQEAAGALQERLGHGYQVTQHGSGSLAVKHGSLAFATVHLRQDGNATTFRVHGGGLIIGRIVNEFGVARTVAAAVRETFRPVPTKPGDSPRS
jgi:hypothetical protein